jgi:hypothetical protein
MLLALRRGVRFRAAAFFAALAMASFVVPPIAVAFAPPEAAAHCLAHAEHGLGHDRAGATRSGAFHDVDHQSPSHEKGDHKSTCCGMFCSTALAPDAGLAIRPVWRDTAVSFIGVLDFYGRAPEQPDRPPISRLSS